MNMAYMINHVDVCQVHVFFIVACQKISLMCLICRYRFTLFCEFDTEHRSAKFHKYVDAYNLIKDE